MEQAQQGKTGSVPVDKRTKEYKTSVGNTDAHAQKVAVGFVHLHGPLFFARKNFKEKIDATDKGPDGTALTMEYDRTEKELVIRCGKHEAFIPSSNIVSYSALESFKKIPHVQPTSGASANTKISAQVSGPHDHVFAGLGQGQTGAGERIK